MPVGMFNLHRILIVVTFVLVGHVAAAPQTNFTGRQGKPTADVEPVDRWFIRHQITPLVPVNDFRRLAEGLK